MSKNFEQNENSNFAQVIGLKNFLCFFSCLEKNHYFSLFFLFFLRVWKKIIFFSFLFFFRVWKKIFFFSSCLEKNHFFGHFFKFFFFRVWEKYVFFLCLEKNHFFGFSLCCDGKILSTSFNIEKNSNFCGLKRIPNFYFNEFGKESHSYLIPNIKLSLYVSY